MGVYNRAIRLGVGQQPAQVGGILPLGVRRGVPPFVRLTASEYKVPWASCWRLQLITYAA